MTAHDVHDVALRQLETALRLYFEGEDYYSVVTLTGAPEEIFGKLVKENERENALESLRKGGAAIHKAHFDEDIPEKEISDRANRVRNFLKHWDPGKPKALEFDAPEEAKDMLDRAVDNYCGLTGSLTPAMQRFQGMHTQQNAHIRRDF